MQLPALFPFQLGKAGAYRIFAGMPKRRVADVVSEACRGHHRLQLVPVEAGVDRISGEMPLDDGIAYGLTQGAPYRCDLKAVRQPVVHEHGPWQREDLRLILKAAKGRGEYDAVVIADIRGARRIGVRVLARAVAGTPGAVKSLPIHGWVKVDNAG